jgi:hypothetical protein
VSINPVITEELLQSKLFVIVEVSGEAWFVFFGLNVFDYYLFSGKDIVLLFRWRLLLFVYLKFRGTVHTNFGYRCFNIRWLFVFGSFDYRHCWLFVLYSIIGFILNDGSSLQWFHHNGTVLLFFLFSSY